jgi:hypothetical protein
MHYFVSEGLSGKALHVFSHLEQAKVVKEDLMQFNECTDIVTVEMGEVSALNRDGKLFIDLQL